MGGFGALKFSDAINPDVVIAAAPQTLVDDELSKGQDDRFREEWRNLAARPLRHSSDACKGITKKAPVLLIADESVSEDRWHINRVSGPQVERLNLGYGGHEVMETIRLAGFFYPFVDACANGDVAKAAELVELMRTSKVHSNRGGFA